ncbi:hypothetical protein C0992_010853 [Termitomyces sp. T32_za158]|nr:hypothetical protein C0992_010853 [Termitomyces sp. T32_za158]
MNPPSTPFSSSAPNYNALSTPSPSLRGRPRGSTTGAKRGRKPRGSTIGAGASLGRPPPETGTSSPTTAFSGTPYVHWASMQAQAGGSSSAGASTGAGAGSSTTTTTAATAASTSTSTYTPSAHYPNVPYTPGAATTTTTTTTTGATSTTSSFALPTSGSGTTGTGTGTGALDAASLLRLASGVLPAGGGGVHSAMAGVLSTLARPAGAAGAGAGGGGGGGDDEGDGDDEMLPAMADDDYSAQLSFQSQSKDNLNPAQYDRFEAYRRHALPKAAVRKVIQQTLGQQVSQPVAQIVAGFAKVFVGEIVEKARAVQRRRGESGPLSPDHLREAYRMYQEETGRVGAARPLKSKRLFVR